MLTYDDTRNTLTINFMVDDFMNMRAAKNCQFITVTKVPNANANTKHRWQVVACWDPKTGKGKNRRIGYLPTEIANMLDLHVQDNPDYIRTGSYARWDASIDAYGVQDGEPWATVDLTLFSQDGCPLFQRTVDEICRNQNVEFIDYDIEYTM